MLTDDQLARELGDVFHTVTADFTYSGRAPRPRRLGTIGVPVAAVGLTAAAVVGFSVASGGGAHVPATHHVASLARASTGLVSPPQPGTSDQASSGSQRGVAGASRTLTVSLAGYTFTYQKPAGDAPLHGEFVHSVPSDATPVRGDDSTSKFYVGVDHSTGDNAGWVRPAHGRILEITSPDATQDQLRAMFAGMPHAIPVVNGSGNGSTDTAVRPSAG